MPRIRDPVGRDDILKNPREFAILKELEAGRNGGDIANEDLMKMAKRLGNKHSSNQLGDEEIDFKDFVAAFQKEGKGVDGEGNCIGWAARDKSGTLAPYKFTRRETRENDVHIKIAYAGMCHSDIHTIRSEWGAAKYPIVPGHEIIGVVVETGSAVTKFKVGDFAGVGCMVDSCLNCVACDKSDEQYCRNGMIGTYNVKGSDGEVTQGGYSTHVIVREHFVVRIPPSLFVPAAAPLLCAGITTYSPMKHFGIDKPGMRVAVQGLGGLGHMAVKFAKGFGQHVTVISRSDAKKESAMNELGADAFLISKDPEAMKAAAGSFDAILDTVSAKHDLGEMVSLLGHDGKLILLGLPEGACELKPGGLVPGRKLIAGSLIGGMEETQGVIDFCAEKGIVCDIEMIDVDGVNDAVERMIDGDVKYRFVIDVHGSLLMD